MDFLEEFFIYAQQTEYFYLFILLLPCFVMTLLPAVSFTNRFSITFQHALFYGVGSLYSALCMSFALYTASKVMFINLPLYSYAIIYAVNVIFCLSNLLKDEYEEKVGYVKGSLVFVAQQVMFLPFVIASIWGLMEFVIGSAAV